MRNQTELSFFICVFSLLRSILHCQLSSCSAAVPLQIFKNEWNMIRVQWKIYQDIVSIEVDDNIMFS